MTNPAIGDLYESKREPGVALADLVALAKPRITALVITTTAGGLYLAPQKRRITRRLSSRNSGRDMCWLRSRKWISAQS